MDEMKTRTAAAAREQEPGFTARFGGVAHGAPRVRWYFSDSDAEELGLQPYHIDMLDHDADPHSLALYTATITSKSALVAGACPRLVAERLRSLAEDARATRTTDDYSRASLELYALGIEWIADLLERCE